MQLRHTLAAFMACLCGTLNVEVGEAFIFRGVRTSASSGDQRGSVPSNSSWPAGHHHSHATSGIRGVATRPRTLSSPIDYGRAFKDRRSVGTTLLSDNFAEGEMWGDNEDDHAKLGKQWPSLAPFTADNTFIDHSVWDITIDDYRDDNEDFVSWLDELNRSLTLGDITENRLRGVDTVDGALHSRLQERSGMVENGALHSRFQECSGRVENGALRPRFQECSGTVEKGSWWIDKPMEDEH